jgi:UDP:flavonoid glycosyltransferase YjiC (YdhE family)
MKIVMAVPSAVGHLNPSFFIANQLVKAGHSVVYLATPEQVGIITANDFTYISSPTVLFSTDNPFIARAGFWERCAKRLTTNEVNFTKNNGALFFEAINKTKPDIVLLDAIISYNYWFIKGHFKVVLLQTMLSTYQDNTPPLTSPLIDDGSTWWGKLQINWQWKKYHLTIKFSVGTVLGDSHYATTKRIFKSERNDFSKLLLKRKTFQYGIVNVKEVILSPASFDFPNRKKQHHQFHAGLCLNNSTESGITEFSQFLETLPPNIKIVYCSLGTLALVHFTRREAFYKKLVNVFKKRSEHLIVSLGDFDKTKLGVLPKNIHAFQGVPQKFLLGRAAMMITHAGLNSVLECIYHKVPMLALPLNSKWDQNGNAARVVYHGLGLRGNINNLTETKLDALVSDVINSDFSQNLHRMKHNFENDQDKVDVVNLIERLVNEFKNENP